MIDNELHKALFEAERNGITPTLIELGAVKWEAFQVWISQLHMVAMDPSDPHFGEDRYCGVPIRRGATPGIVIS